MMNTIMLKTSAIILLIGVMLTGYGGLCEKDKETDSGSSTPKPDWVCSTLDSTSSIGTNTSIVLDPNKSLSENLDTSTAIRN
ncbi:MAG: hypothetical protein HY762_08330 [Planctomycetes bacterium]|nr:hypothetical protein [Planctomycetota bacterium]